MKLLSINSDSKTIKGVKKGYLTGIMYMAPEKISGYQVCPNSSQACRDACLYTAGRGIFSNVQRSRVGKTKWFFEDKENFLIQLIKEIGALLRKADKENLIPVVRLNGTSDINWMKIKFPAGPIPARKINIFTLFPGLQFYDYTKNFNMLSQSEKIENYHLTFSASGENKSECEKALKKGFNVAMVFNSGFPLALSLSENQLFRPMRQWKMHPKIWTILDGDKSDLRFLDQGKYGPFIIGLIAKGKARKQHSSFIL